MSSDEKLRRRKLFVGRSFVTWSRLSTGGLPSLLFYLCLYFSQSRTCKPSSSFNLCELFATINWFEFQFRISFPPHLTSASLSRFILQSPDLRQSIMPNLLIMSLEGFSASSRQMYPQLFPKILSRTTVHESLTPQDALNYIGSGWPNIIMVSDPAIAKEENRHLLEEIVAWVKHGCTMVCMGFFSSTIEYTQMDAIFRENFGLKWRAEEYTSHDVRLHNGLAETMIRRASLVPSIHAKAVFLGHVPSSEVVYAGGP
jgi:hypothetical protein